MAYALEYQRDPGFAPDFTFAASFASAVQQGVEMLEACKILLGVAYGPDDYLCGLRTERHRGGHPKIAAPLRIMSIARSCSPDTQCRSLCCG